jgi:hypothetical protein
LWLGLRSDELERHESLLAFFVVLPLVSAAGRLAGQWRLGVLALKMALAL